LGEEEHKFDGEAPAAQAANDINAKNDAVDNMYADADDENIRGTVAPGGSQKPE